MFLCTHTKNIFAHRMTQFFFCSANTLLTEGHILFSHRTHGMTQNWFHVFTRIYTEHLTRKDAKGRGDLWAHRTESRCPNL
jgi:hypothetical protein